MVGAIGMAVGSGLCAPAVVAAIMALFNLVFLMLIERSILPLVTSSPQAFIRDSPKQTALAGFSPHFLQTDG
jgi:uncharacterized membrane protein YhiD involved in acid resistance